MWHAYGDAHLHSDGDCDGNCHIHSDCDSNSDIYCNGDRYGYSDSNGDGNCDCYCTAAAYTDATASADTAASTVRPAGCLISLGTRERTSRVPNNRRASAPHATGFR